MTSNFSWSWTQLVVSTSAHFACALLYLLVSAFDWLFDSAKNEPALSILMAQAIQPVLTLGKIPHRSICCESHWERVEKYAPSTLLNKWSQLSNVDLTQPRLVHSDNFSVSAMQHALVNLIMADNQVCATQLSLLWLTDAGCTPFSQSTCRIVASFNYSYSCFVMISRIPTSLTALKGALWSSRCRKNTSRHCVRNWQYVHLTDHLWKFETHQYIDL